MRFDVFGDYLPSSAYEICILLLLTSLYIKIK